jgi:hypothetical protein
MNPAVRAAVRSILAATGAVVAAAAIGGCTDGGHPYDHAEQAPPPSVLATEAPAPSSSPSASASGTALPTHAASATPSIAGTGACASATDPAVKLACQFVPHPLTPPPGWQGTFGSILAAAPGVDWQMQSATPTGNPGCDQMSFQINVVGGPAGHVYTILLDWGLADVQTSKISNVVATSHKLPALSPGQAYSADFTSCVSMSAFPKGASPTITGYGVQ